MRPALTLALLAACGDPSPEPARAARALVEAAAAGDADRAASLLPPEDACAALDAGYQVERCREGVARARAELPEVIAELRGARVTAARRRDIPTPHRDWSVYAVTVEAEGDRDTIEVVTVVHAGRAYASVARKRKVEGP